jgi:hypothetical protein
MGAWQNTILHRGAIFIKDSIGIGFGTPSFCEERDDGVLDIHAFNGLPTKFIAIPLSLFSFHFAAPSP